MGPSPRNARRETPCRLIVLAAARAALFFVLFALAPEQPASGDGALVLRLRVAQPNSSSSCAGLSLGCAVGVVALTLQLVAAPPGPAAQARKETKGPATKGSVNDNAAQGSSHPWNLIKNWLCWPCPELWIGMVGIQVRHASVAGRAKRRPRPTSEGLSYLLNEQ